MHSLLAALSLTQIGRLIESVSQVDEESTDARALNWKNKRRKEREIEREREADAKNRQQVARLLAF